MLHFPVLLEESVDFLVNKKEGSYIDCTYGRGGHTQKILETISSNSQLTSFDKDSDAIEHANNIQNTNFKIIQDSFSNINKYFSKDSVDGILYDLGTCSTHFDDASRGFSFRHNGPLDMRFDTKKGKPLADWINKATENDIKEVLYLSLIHI